MIVPWQVLHMVMMGRPMTSALARVRALIGSETSVVSTPAPLHPTSVSKALAKMGITIKKPTVLALGAMRPENIAKRRDFAGRFFRNVDVAAIGDWRREAKAFRDWIPVLDPDLVFFGDQSGVNRTTANARKARSLRGQPAPALRPAATSSSSTRLAARTPTTCTCSI